jgi:hypothetical protein
VSHQGGGLRASGLARRLDQATKIHFQLKFSEHFQVTQSPLELNQNSKNSKAVLFLSNLNQKLKTLLGLELGRRNKHQGLTGIGEI